MKIRVIYKSKKNTKKIAEAIGKQLGVTPEEITNTLQVKEADIIYLGCGIYAGDVPVEVKEFVMKLQGENIGKIVLFFTSGSGLEQGTILKELIWKMGIPFEETVFCSKGSMFLFLNRNKPDQEDIKRAMKFARDRKGE